MSLTALPARHPHPAPLSAASQAAALTQAIVAAYALMAHADGEVAGSERRRLFAALRDSPALETLSRDEVAAQAAEHEANFRLDPEVAQQIAWEKLAPIAGHRRATLAVIRACRDLIPADGIAHPSEYRTLADIRSRLGVDDLTTLA